MTQRPGAASGKEYADALTDFLEASKEKAASKPPRRRRRRAAPWVFAMVVPGAAYAAWSNYQYAQPPRPPGPAVEDRVAQVALLTTIDALENHRRDSGGELPETLDAVDPPQAEWTYERADTGYTLGVRLGTASLEYRSGEDYERFLTTAELR